MFKILIIEILLSVVLGAILFRLVWALTRSQVAAWAGVLIACITVMVFVPGHVDENLIIEYGGKFPVSRNLSPFMVNILHCLGLVVGAWLASMAVTTRKKLDLKMTRPIKIFRNLHARQIFVGLTIHSFSRMKLYPEMLVCIFTASRVFNC